MSDIFKRPHFNGTLLKHVFAVINSDFVVTIWSHFTLVALIDTQTEREQQTVDTGAGFNIMTRSIFGQS